jgi:hypothetical protein
MNIPKPTHVEARPGSIFGFRPGNHLNTDSQDISDNIEDPDYVDMYTSYNNFDRGLSSFCSVQVVLILNLLISMNRQGRKNG